MYNKRIGQELFMHLRVRRLEAEILTCPSLHPSSFRLHPLSQEELWLN